MIENSIVYRNFKGKYEYLPIAKAAGAEIWDRDGKRYIDFTSAWNVTNLGWNNEEVNLALIEQAKENVQSLLWGSTQIQEDYAAVLTAALPQELNACVKATGGTEAVESSIKIARVYTKRKKVIGFDGLYHGQLFAALALGAPGSKREKLAPLVPDITPIPFPHEDIGSEGFEKFLEDFDTLLSHEDVAAVVTEPGIITGWGSTLIAYPGFLKQLRVITQKYGTLLIVDEVGSGFSRTGKLFGIEHAHVVPDMVVFAKGMSNGAAAIGTVVGKSEIFEDAFTDATLISTFGWTPVACAAALKTLQVHQRDKTWELAQEKGEYVVKKLSKKIGDKLINVRGQGMEVGLRCKNSETAQNIQKKTFADGLHIVVGSENNIQIMPPLTISKELLDEGLTILEKHLV
jgi:4-aminobutyrate aminotransferase-like enzyme